MNAAERRRDEGGFSSLELSLGVALIFFPIAVLLMLLPQWPERQAIARALAKQAAITIANAQSPDSGDAKTLELAAETAANHELPPDTLRLAWSGDWCRGCSVTATVTIAIPAIRVPVIGSIDSFTWSTSSTQRIADYRSIG